MQGIITCPHCHKTSEAEIPADRCQYFYVCPHCRQRLKPKGADCCVFCSFSDTRCPSSHSPPQRSGQHKSTLRLFCAFKGILGVLLLMIGIVALITPFTPGAWLILVGLELLGLGFLIPSGVRKYWARMKSRIGRGSAYS